MLGVKNGVFRFTILGLQITVDFLMPLALLLLAWVLSSKYFPAVIYLQKNSNYIILGATGSISLLLSILLHEFGHAYAAKILQIPIERIHIYLFGGMAELRHRPLIPIQEFFVSMAGPIVSGVLSLSFFIILTSLDPKTQSLAYFSVHFVAFMNLILAFFNLIPVYPLDGGRALRALIWRKHQNFYSASKLMHRLSSGFIGLLFLITLLLFFTVDSYHSFWLGTFCFYSAYLLMNAKSELTANPEFSELIFKLDKDSSPAQIIDKIMDVNPDALNNAIVPVFIAEKFEFILFGNEVLRSFPSNLSLNDILRTPEPGTFINILDSSTFSGDLKFKAEFIPVFNGNEFSGLCDAFEMTFWLNEKKK